LSSDRSPESPKIIRSLKKWCRHTWATPARARFHYWERIACRVALVSEDHLFKIIRITGWLTGQQPSHHSSSRIALCSTCTVPTLLTEPGLVEPTLTPGMRVQVEDLVASTKTLPGPLSTNDLIAPPGSLFLSWVEGLGEVR
jgi:hypothetical protein